MSNEVIGIIAGVLTSASMLPQLIKTIKKKEASDLSAYIFIMLIVGTGLWAYYGVLKNDIPIIATNLFSVVLNGIGLFLKFKYSPREEVFS
ncbi:SemiSWEET family sugar transporter [Desertivirga brevis]|uniref:SemiSWEET family sugar transporter n=1 Tax=Desertivirga brevis TaxID=2810310 RepID=UPI001A95CB65|nr:SemiSWEET transporter [Pedobacter sp. SYSU D00873]